MPDASVVAEPVPVHVIVLPDAKIVPVQMAEPFLATTQVVDAVAVAVDDHSHVEQFEGTVTVPLLTG